MKLPDDIKATRAPERDMSSSIAFDVVRVETVHLCPPSGSGVMPCCDRTPFEVPRYHRMTLDRSLATCPHLDPRPSQDAAGDAGSGT